MTSGFTLCQNPISKNVVLLTRKHISKSFYSTNINKFSKYILNLTCVCNSVILSELNRFLRCGIKTNGYKIGRDISMRTTGQFDNITSIENKSSKDLEYGYSIVKETFCKFYLWQANCAVYIFIHTACEIFLNLDVKIYNNFIFRVLS